MSNIRFAVVANCQARPVSTIINHAQPEWHHVGDIIVHLTSLQDRDAHLELLGQADIIFAQLVGDKYPIAHVRTSELKDIFGDRVVTWPNLFFHGQTTDTFNLTTTDGRVRGPLADYHSLIVHDHWRRALPVEDCISAMLDPAYGNAEEILGRATRSLIQLEMRERQTDVGIADFVAERWRDQSLFHVFNHPCSVTLIEMVDRLLRAVGQPAARQVAARDVGEPLGQLLPVLPRAHVEAVGLAYPVRRDAIGRDVAIEGCRVANGPGRQWSLGEFIETSYRCYDAQGEAVRFARFTPAAPDYAAT